MHLCIITLLHLTLNSSRRGSALCPLRGGARHDGRHLPRLGRRIQHQATPRQVHPGRRQGTEGALRRALDRAGEVVKIHTALTAHKAGICPKRNMSFFTGASYGK